MKGKFSALTKPLVRTELSEKNSLLGGDTVNIGEVGTRSRVEVVPWDHAQRRCTVVAHFKGDRHKQDPAALAYLRTKEMDVKCILGGGGDYRQQLVTNDCIKKIGPEGSCLMKLHNEGMPAEFTL